MTLRSRLLTAGALAIVLVGSICGTLVYIEAIDAVLSVSKTYRQIRVKSSARVAGDVMHVEDMYMYQSTTGARFVLIDCRWQDGTPYKDNIIRVELLDGSGKRLDEVMWYQPRSMWPQITDKTKEARYFRWTLGIPNLVQLPGKFRLRIVAETQSDREKGQAPQVTEISLPNVAYLISPD